MAIEPNAMVGTGQLEAVRRLSLPICIDFDEGRRLDFRPVGGLHQWMQIG